MLPNIDPPARDIDPAVRSNYWDDIIQALELTYVNNFDPAHEVGVDFASSGEVFADFYQTLIRALGGLFNEQARDDSDKNRTAVGHPIRRAIFLLNESLEYVWRNGNNLGDDNVFAIRDHLAELARAPWNSIDTRVSYHTIGMTSAIDDVVPDGDVAWNGGDINGSDRFDELFAAFQAYGNDPLRFETDCIHLIRASQTCLEKAYNILRLPQELIFIPEDLLDANQKPTYVEFSCNAPEFLYGRTGRRGILAIKAALGGPLTDNERALITAANRRRSRDEDAADAPEEPARRRRGAAPYTMTVANVDADILNLNCDAQRRHDIVRPDAALLITPTLPYPQAVMDTYQRDFLEFLRTAETNFGTPNSLPATPAARQQMLDDLDNIIGEMRNTGAEQNDGNSNLQLKRARVTAFKIKYLRSLYMKIILTQNPPVADDVLRAALAARLADWAFHESIWSTMDTIAAGRRLKTATRAANRARKRQLLNDVNRRTRNETRWEEMQAAVIAGDDADGADGADGAGGGGGEPAPAPAPEPAPAPAPAEGVVPPGQALQALLRIIGPSLPGRSVFNNERLEREREHWYRECIAARTRGERPPQRPVLRDAGAGPLAAGGPPDFDQLPTGTVWERLQYIIVMTHWRISQARFLL